MSPVARVRLSTCDSRGGTHLMCVTMIMIIPIMIHHPSGGPSALCTHQLLLSPPHAVTVAVCVWGASEQQCTHQLHPPPLHVHRPGPAPVSHAVAASASASAGWAPRTDPPSPACSRL